MLERVRLQNYKAHRDTEIKLGRLTVLVGPNGAGKSSVLQAIAGGAGAHRPSSVITLEGSRQGPPRRWSVERSDGPDLVKVIGGQSHLKMPRQIPLSEVLGATFYISPDSRRLAAPSHSETIIPTLESDGSGLSEVLAHLLLSDPDGFAAVQAGLRAVVPQVDRIRVKRTQMTRPRTRMLSLDGRVTQVHDEEDVIGTALVFDVAGRTEIDANDISGGTLIALGILTALLGTRRPDVALIDDLEQGLHPRAQWDLLRYLRKMLERFPDLQIVATTHSPDLVDELQPEEVIVMALRKDGTVAARPLTECPRADMLGVLRAGELWSAVGEDWVKAEPETGA